MRVLILSCNTGEGHNSCGKAIQESFRSRGIPCEMEDALRFISPTISKLITFGFVRIYRHLPGLFRFGYWFAENHDGMFRERAGIYKMITAGAERLYNFIQDEDYDTVICTHVFSALILTDILRRYHPALHTCFVATDYTCSPSCGQSELDAYYIPDETLEDDFSSCGLPPEKLISSGIPIRRDFFQSVDRAAVRAHIGLPADCRHLLVMCGSMGCGPIRSMVKQMGAQLPENCDITVICGTNHSLRRKLERDHAGQPHIHIYGFRKDISSLMDSADLYLTKPGGISTSEAAIKRLPMVFVNAVAGCESYNMRFFMRQGAAATAETPEELAALALSLLTDPQRLEAMSASFHEPPAQSPADRICDDCLNLQTAGSQRSR